MPIKDDFRVPCVQLVRTRDAKPESSSGDNFKSARGTEIFVYRYLRGSTFTGIKRPKLLFSTESDNRFLFSIEDGVVTLSPLSSYSSFF